MDTWSVADPYFNSPTLSFDPITGTYTVPFTGRYLINATINYQTTAAITVDLGDAINPAFVVRRISPVVTDLLTGLFPVLDVAILALLTLRTILGSGTVTIAGEVELSAGDTVGLFYEADGLIGIDIDIGGADSGTFFSINQIA